MQAQIYPGSTLADFHRILAANPDARIEMDAAGTVTVSPPAGSASGHRNARLTHAVLDWSERHGYIAFDSSTGFALADGSIVSPDAAIVSTARWEALSVAQREGFAPIAPDVAIELASQSDRPKDLQAKLRHFRAAGTGFVALIDPYRKTIWTDGTPPAGFSIDLEALLT